MRGLFTVILLFLLTGPASLHAGHLYGGAITWECAGGGDYIFHLTIYRDCDAGSVTGSAEIGVKGHPNVDTILLSLDTAYDIAPDCQQVPGGASSITCSGGGEGAIEKAVLSSSPIDLSGGSPPASGWVFSWSAQTRSSGPDNIINSGSQGITVRSKMFPHPGGVDSCMDASPRFSEPPVTILCKNNEVEWSSNAVDPNSDSLSYEWAKPLGKTNGNNFDPPNDPVPLSFQSGFSYDRPFPGIQSGTGPAPDRLAPSTGDLVLQDPSQGDHAYVVKVNSWRGGQKVAEVYREAGLVISACLGNTTHPEILPPFGGSFRDTFQVGQSLNFPIRAVDEGDLQDGSAQTVSLAFQSEAFGQNYNDPSSGCPNPPCATLTPTPPNGSSDTVSSTLEWTLDCSHFSSPGPAGSGRFERYDILVRAKDDHCSVPGQSMRTVSIFVENEGPVPPPTVNCIDRQSGDLALSWTSLSGSYPSFAGYVIYRANSEGGPFVPIDTVSSIGSANYVDPGAASGPDRFYFIRSLYGCQGKSLSSPSDTLQRLDLNVSDPSNGTAQLSWNELATSDTAPAPGTGYYRILKEHPMGNWQVIDSVPYGTTQYTDTVMVCSDTLSYRIEIMDDQRGCISSSNIDGGTFSDVLAPSVPEIQNVSVDTSIGKATIDWDAVPQTDTRGYLVIQIIAGTEYVIDTVWGRTNTFYTYSGSSAPSTSENFAIAAFDSCYSGTPPRPNTSTRGDIHNSMNLTGTKKVCAKKTHLSWNPYQNWESGVDEYRVYFIEKGSPPFYVGRTQAGDTTMTHGKVPLNEPYCYVVKAVSNSGKTALSDKECFTIDFPKPPDFHYLASASVLPGNKGVEIRSLVDTTADLPFFRLERKPPQGAYEEVRTRQWDGSYPFEMTDLTATPDEGSYSYRVVVEDSCGNELFTSNLGQTIHLTVGSTREPPVNVLQWSHYGEWDGQVSGYGIHRIDRKKGIDSLLDVVSPMRQSYEHNVGRAVQEENGRYCYYVVARESGNSYGRDEVARSNEACAHQKPYIYIPNAYIVNGTSGSFNAVTGHIREEGYRLRIFNRWGEKIFETTDPEEGWKGKDMKGDPVPEGVYVYHFMFRSSEGKRIEKRGGVTLLRK
ncbi:MAG: gliding motility-associated C-terminal domain-containing protein [Flavobacteriales bacterium]